MSDKRRYDLAFVFIAFGFGALWLWYALVGRSLATDDGISYAAARGIAETGLPLLPSGQLYDRGYLAHYLVGGALALFGDQVGVFITSLGLALGALFLTYRIGRDLLARPFVGLIATALVAMSAEQAYYATSPRMYMALQFFCTLAVYAAYRGFVRNERAYRVLTGFALLCAFACERGAGVLTVALLVALSLASGARVVFSRASLFVLACVLAGAYLAFVFKPANAYVPMVSEGGRIPRFIALNVFVDKWFWHLLQLEQLLPFLLALVGTAYVALFTRRMQAAERYLAALVPIAFVQVAASMNFLANRFFHFLLPMLALLAAFGLLAMWTERRLRVTSFGLVSILVTMAVYRSDHLARYYGGCAVLLPKCDPETSPRVREVHETLASELRPSDLVLSSNPWVTYYYLGRVDGFLRQRFKEGGGFTTFPLHRDEYYGAILVDRRAKLYNLLDSLEEGGRAFFVLDYKADKYMSESLRAAVRDATRPAIAGDLVSVHLATPSDRQLELSDASAWALDPP